MQAETMEEQRFEFLSTMVHSVVERARRSMSEGRIDADLHRVVMQDALALRDETDKLANEEIEARLKTLTSVVGAGRLFDLLELYHGPEFMSLLPELLTPMVELYDEAFYPIACRFKDDGDDAVGEDELLVMGPPSANVVVRGDIRNDGIQAGSLVISHPQGLIMGHFVQDTAKYFIDKSEMLQDLVEDVVERVPEELKEFGQRYVEALSIKTLIENVLPEDLILRVTEAGAKLDAWKKQPEAAVRKEFRDLDRLHAQREMLMLLLLEDVHPTVFAKLYEPSVPAFQELMRSLPLPLQTRFFNYVVDSEKHKRHRKRKHEEAETRPSLRPKVVRITDTDSDVEEVKRPPKLSLRQRVRRSRAPAEAKERALRRVKEIEKARGDGDAKAEKYVEGFLKIPFGKVHEANVIRQRRELMAMASELDGKLTRRKRKRGKTVAAKTFRFESEVAEVIGRAAQLRRQVKLRKALAKKVQTFERDRTAFLQNARRVLDNEVHGHAEAKECLERVIAQWVSGDAIKGNVVCLMGPPGNGKTSLVKAVSKCLKDKDGKEHPCELISLGGMSDSSILLGHSYTYVGSEWGKIMATVIRAGVENSIIILDEIDKVGRSSRGVGVTSVLTALTDPSVNNHFVDEYFQFPIDLSKCLFVCTFNDAHKIDRVLRDRMHIIETKPLRPAEKETIARDFMLPKLLPEAGFAPGDVIIDDEDVRWLCETYTCEAGVRRLKERLSDACREVARLKALGQLNVPCKLDRAFLENMFRRKHKVQYDKISDEPRVGMFNGLYACSTGLGGITLIQAIKTRAGKTPFALTLTGLQGETMKESMQCALSVAWSFLTKEEQAALEKDPFSIQIHCPAGGTPKDGPSAGNAIALALLSLFKQKKVSQYVCMTGEIDLTARTTKIGGLDAKLVGAQKAGCRIAYIPRENQEDYDRIVEDKLLDPDLPFEVVVVDSLQQVLDDGRVFVD